MQQTTTKLLIFKWLMFLINWFYCVCVVCLFKKYIVHELVLHMNSKNMHGEKIKITVVLFENFFLYSLFFYIVLLITIIVPVIYLLFIALVVLSYLCVYLSCWVAAYAYIWININRGWTDNGNTRQNRNKTVFVGCTERILVVSLVFYFFF